MTLTSITINQKGGDSGLYVGVYSCFLAPGTGAGAYVPGIGYPLIVSTPWVGTVNDILSDPGVFTIGFKDGLNYVPVFQVIWLTAPAVSVLLKDPNDPNNTNAIALDSSSTTNNIIVNITGFKMPVISGFNITTSLTPAEIDMNLSTNLTFSNTSTPLPKAISVSKNGYAIPSSTGVSGQSVAYTGIITSGSSLTNQQASFAEKVTTIQGFTPLSFDLQFNQISGTLPVNFTGNLFYAVAVSASSDYNPIITLTISYNWIWLFSASVSGMVLGQEILMESLASPSSDEGLFLGPYLPYQSGSKNENSGYLIDYYTSTPSSLTASSWAYTANYPALVNTNRTFNALSAATASSSLFSVDFSKLLPITIGNSINALFKVSLDNKSADKGLAITYSGLTVLTFAPTQYVTIPIYMAVLDATYFANPSAGMTAGTGTNAPGQAAGYYEIPAYSATQSNTITVGLSLAALPTATSPVTIKFYGNTALTEELFSLQFDGTTTITAPTPPSTSLFSATPPSAASQTQTIAINYTGIISLEFAMTGMSQMSGETIAMSFPAAVTDQTLTFTPNIYAKNVYALPVSCSGSNCIGTVGTNIVDFSYSPLTFGVGTTPIFTIPITKTSVGPNASVVSSPIDLSKIFSVTVDTTTSPNTPQTPEIEITYTGIRTITFTLTDPDPAVGTIYMGTGAAGSVVAVTGLSTSSISNSCAIVNKCTLSALTVDLSFINNLGTPITFYSDSAYKNGLFSIVVGKDNNVTITNPAGSLYAFSSTTISPTATTMDVPITIQYTGLQSVEFVVSGTTQPIDMQITDASALSTTAVVSTDKSISRPVDSDKYFSLPATYSLAIPVQTAVTYSGKIMMLSDFAGKKIQFSIEGTNIFTIPFTSTSVTLGATCTTATALGYCVSVTGTNRPLITIVYSGIQSIAFEIVQPTGNGLQSGDVIIGSPTTSPVPSISTTCTSAAPCHALVPISLISSSANAITYSLPVPAIGSAPETSIDLFSITYASTGIAKGKVTSSVTNCTVTNSGTATNPIIQITYQTLSSIKFIVTNTIEAMNMIVNDAKLVFSPVLTTITGGFSIPSGTHNYNTSSFTSNDLGYFRNTIIPFNDADGQVFTLTFTDTAITPDPTSTDLVYNITGAPDSKNLGNFLPIDPINPVIYITYAGIQSVSFNMINIPSADSLITTIPFDALSFATGMGIKTLTTGDYEIPAACAGANCLGTVGKISDFKATSFDFSVGITKVFRIPVTEMSVGPTTGVQSDFPSIFAVTVDTTSPNTTQTPEIEIAYKGIQSIAFNMLTSDPTIINIYMDLSDSITFASGSAVTNPATGAEYFTIPVKCTAATCVGTIDLSIIKYLVAPINFYDVVPTTAGATSIFSLTFTSTGTITATNGTLYTIGPIPTGVTPTISITYIGIQTITVTAAGLTGSQTLNMVPGTVDATSGSLALTATKNSGSVTAKVLADLVKSGLNFNIGSGTPATTLFNVGFTSTSMTTPRTPLAGTFPITFAATTLTATPYDPGFTLTYTGLQTITFVVNSGYPTSFTDIYMAVTDSTALSGNTTITCSSTYCTIPVSCTAATCKATVGLILANAGTVKFYSDSALASATEIFELSFNGTAVTNETAVSGSLYTATISSTLPLSPTVTVQYIGIQTVTFVTTGMNANQEIDLGWTTNPFNPSVSSLTGNEKVVATVSDLSNLLLPSLLPLTVGSATPLQTLFDLTFSETTLTLPTTANFPSWCVPTLSQALPDYTPTVNIAYTGIKTLTFVLEGTTQDLVIAIGASVLTGMKADTNGNYTLSAVMEINSSGALVSVSSLPKYSSPVSIESLLSYFNTKSIPIQIMSNGTLTTLFSLPFTMTGVTGASTKDGTYTATISGDSQNPIITITYTGVQSVSFSIAGLPDELINMSTTFKDALIGNTNIVCDGKNCPLKTANCITTGLCTAIVGYDLLQSSSSITFNLPVATSPSSNIDLFELTFSPTTVTVNKTDDTVNCAVTATQKDLKNPSFAIAYTTLQSITISVTGTTQEIDMVADSGLTFSPAITYALGAYQFPRNTSNTAYKAKITSANLAVLRNQPHIAFNIGDTENFYAIFTDPSVTVTTDAADKVYSASNTPDAINPVIAIAYSGLQTVGFNASGFNTLPTGATAENLLVNIDNAEALTALKGITYNSPNYSVPTKCTGTTCLGTAVIADYDGTTGTIIAGSTVIANLAFTQKSVQATLVSAYSSMYKVAPTSTSTGQTPVIAVTYSGLQSIAFDFVTPDLSLKTIFMQIPEGAIYFDSAITTYDSTNNGYALPIAGCTGTPGIGLIDIIAASPATPINFCATATNCTSATALFTLTFNADNSITAKPIDSTLYTVPDTTGVKPTISVTYNGLRTLTFVVAGTTEQITMTAGTGTSAETYLIPTTCSGTSCVYKVTDITKFKGSIPFTIGVINIFNLTVTETSVSPVTSEQYAVTSTTGGDPTITITYSGIQSVTFEIVQPTTGNGLQTGDAITGVTGSPVASITTKCTGAPNCSAIVPISLISSSSNAIAYSLGSISLFSLTYAETGIPKGVITSLAANCTVTNTGTPINPIIQISYSTLSSITIGVAGTNQTIGMVAPTGMTFPNITWANGYYPIPSNSSLTAKSYTATVTVSMLPDFRNLAAGISFYTYDANGAESTNPIFTLKFTDTAVTISGADSNYSISGAATAGTPIDPINPEIYITYNGIQSVAFVTTGMASGITIDSDWTSLPFESALLITGSCTSSCVGTVNSLSNLENDSTVVNFKLEGLTATLFGLTFSSTTTTLTTSADSSTGYAVSLKGSVAGSNTVTTATPEIDITYTGIQTVTFNWGADVTGTFNMNVDSNTFTSQTSANQAITSGKAYTVLTLAQLTKVITVSYGTSNTFTVDFSASSYTIKNTDSVTTGYMAALNTKSTTTNPIIDINFAIQSLQFVTTGMGAGQEIDITTSPNPFSSAVSITSAATSTTPVTGTLANPSPTNAQAISFQTKDSTPLFSLTFNGSAAPSVGGAVAGASNLTGYTVTSSLSANGGTAISPLISITYAGISTISFSQVGVLPGVAINMVVGTTSAPISTTTPYVVQTLSNFLGRTITFTDGAATPTPLFKLTFASTAGPTITVSNQANGYNVVPTVTGSGPYTVAVAITYKTPPVVTFVVGSQVGGDVGLVDPNQDLSNLQGDIKFHPATPTESGGYTIPSTCTGTACNATIGNGLLFNVAKTIFNLGNNKDGKAITCPVDFATTPITASPCSDTNYSISVSGNAPYAAQTITIDYSHQVNFALSGGVGEFLSWTGASAYTTRIDQLVNSQNGMTAEVSSGSSSFKTEAENPNYPGSTYVPISANSQLQAEMYIDSEVISLLTTLTPTATTSLGFIIPLTASPPRVVLADGIDSNIILINGAVSAGYSFNFTLPSTQPPISTDVPGNNFGTVSSSRFSFNIVLPDTTLKTAATYSKVAGTVTITDITNGNITLTVTSGTFNSTNEQWTLQGTLSIYSITITAGNFTALIIPTTDPNYPSLIITGTFPPEAKLPTFAHSILGNSKIALTFSNGS